MWKGKKNDKTWSVLHKLSILIACLSHNSLGFYAAVQLQQQPQVNQFWTSYYKTRNPYYYPTEGENARDYKYRKCRREDFLKRLQFQFLPPLSNQKSASSNGCPPFLAFVRLCSWRRQRKLMREASNWRRCPLSLHPSSEYSCHFNNDNRVNRQNGSSATVGRTSPVYSLPWQLRPASETHLPLPSTDHH